MDSLIDTGLIYLILGLALIVLAYFLPGIWMVSDRQEGLRLLEDREAARTQRKSQPWAVYALSVVLWPWVDWERVDTHQNWAMYIKQREDSNDTDSNGPPRSEKKNGESGD